MITRGLGGLQDWMRRRDSPDIQAKMLRIGEREGALPSRIGQLRIAAGLRQRDVVRQLGLAQDRMSKFENGHAAPDPDEAAALAELFRVPKRLLSTKDEAERSPEAES